MSLQRVFESARKMGVPVIVTDPSGRDPMVVLPLEQFEALNQADESPKTRQTQPIPAAEPIRIAEKPRNIQKMQEMPLRSEMPFPQGPGPEISLEERFYLEPTDDDQVS